MMPGRSKFIPYLMALAFLILAVSCKDRTVQQLSRTWDCVQVDNLDPLKKNFTSPEDSVLAYRLQESLKTLTWTFTDDRQYHCRIGQRITTKGTYQITDNGSTLICTTESKNTINRYSIRTISADELVLENRSGGTPLVMHFKPHD
ncbi:MAG: hypothetical protein IPI66_05140 [Chitinophagaceae bacterium]|nr:hypothetical protein [Chitinophagaceae bacterium]